MVKGMYRLKTVNKLNDWSLNIVLLIVVIFAVFMFGFFVYYLVWLVLALVAIFHKGLRKRWIDSGTTERRKFEAKLLILLLPIARWSQNVIYFLPSCRVFPFLGAGVGEVRGDR